MELNNGSKWSKSDSRSFASYAGSAETERRIVRLDMRRDFLSQSVDSHTEIGCVSTKKCEDPWETWEGTHGIILLRVARGRS